MPKIEVAPSVELPDELPPSNRKTAFLDKVEDLVRAHYKELKHLLSDFDNSEESKLKRGLAALKIQEIAVEEGFGDIFEGKKLTQIRNATNKALGRAHYSNQQRLAKKKLLDAPQQDAEPIV
jgi:hypothetical protein